MKELAAEITIEERLDWRRENTREVHTRFEEKLQELEKKAKKDNDNRLAFEILRFRAAYALGTPVPGVIENISVSEMIRKIGERLRGAVAARPLLPGATPESTGNKSTPERRPVEQRPLPAEIASPGGKDWSAIDRPAIPPEVLKEIGERPPGSRLGCLWDVNAALLAKKPSIVDPGALIFEDSSADEDEN